MKNVTELRNELAEVFARLREGDVAVKTASEMNNCAGKMINSLKVEIDYNLTQKNNKKIKFME